MRNTRALRARGAGSYSIVVRGASVDKLQVTVHAEDPLVRAALVRLLNEPGDALEGQRLVAREGYPLGEEVESEVMLLDLGLDIDAGMESLRHHAGSERPLLVLVPSESDVLPVVAAGASGALTR